MEGDRRDENAPNHERREPDVYVEFAADAAAPRDVRRALRSLFEGPDDPIAYNVELVASELVSNVIQHTDGGGSVGAWDPKPDVPFHLEVADSSPVDPVPQPEPSHLGGRGLSLVDDLADGWGVHRRTEGKVVWADFNRPQPPKDAAPAAPVVASTDPALVVVTASMDGQPAGCLVQFHTQSNVEPFRYAVWLDKSNATCRAAAASELFSVHFLGKDDGDLARRFGTGTSDTGEKFADVSWVAGAGNVPLLQRCTTRLLLRTVARMDDGGGHLCLIGEQHPDATPATGPLDPLRVSHLDR